MDDEEEKKYYGGELPTVNITAKRSTTQNTLEKTKKEAEEYAKKIAGQTFTTNEIFGFNNATTKAEKKKKANLKTNGDTPGSFSEADTRIAAGGSDKSLDQVAKEFADKEAYSPTGIWEFDLGYAAGRARKKKIDAAGGKEAFKAAKQEKRSARRESRAIAKERKNFQPIDKIPKTKLKSSSGRSSILASGLRDASEYHSPSLPSKNKKQQRKDLKQKIAGIKTEVTNRPKINYGSVTNKKEAKGLPTKGKYGI